MAKLSDYYGVRKDSPSKSTLTLYRKISGNPPIRTGLADAAAASQAARGSAARRLSRREAVSPG